MNRRSRFAAALVALVALAFAQLALPAHGCPHVAQMQVMTQASMDGMPCERHCVESAKSFDAVKPVVHASAPAVAIAAPLRVALAVAPWRRAAPIPAPSLLGPAPPFLRSTVLRI